MSDIKPEYKRLITKEELLELERAATFDCQCQCEDEGVTCEWDAQDDEGPICNKPWADPKFVGLLRAQYDRIMQLEGGLKEIAYGERTPDSAAAYVDYFISVAIETLRGDHA